jgi:hypothetical protein
MPGAGMARSLLSLRLVTLALIASASSMSACIIPVAPNFQDPPSVPNSPPYVTPIAPTVGEIATFTFPSLTFTATVTDLNVNTPIFYRWLGDYPPNVEGVTWRVDNPAQISPRLDGLPISQSLSQDLTCGLVHNVSGTHRVELVVADRQFQDSSMAGLTSDNQYDSLIDPTNTGHIVRTPWIVSMSCPASTTSSPSSP